MDRYYAEIVILSKVIKNRKYSVIENMEKILFEHYDLDQKYAVESVWAERVGEYYKLDNILFYAPNYSWGDIVEVENRNGELNATGLITEAGHSTIRINFYRHEYLESTLQRLKEIGCDYERSNIPLLISVDIPPEVEYEGIRAFLNEGEEKEKWNYQEACLAHK